MTEGHRLQAGSASRTIGVVGVLALLFALLPYAVASAQTFTNTMELDADDSVGAAIAWSQATFNSATDVALGRNDVFADNLASSLIQGRHDAPLLLTPSNSLDQRVLDELERLGADDVHILGGTAAISQSVQNQLEAAGYNTHRDSGTTRIETAIDIAATHAPNATEALLVRAFGGPAGDETQAWADALAAGGWAADEEIPVLLTQTDELNDNLETYLRQSQIESITVIGGNAAISQAVVAELQAMGITVNRVSGANRFHTAVRVAEARGFASAGDADRVLLVEGQAANAWASGFPAAAHADQHNAPIVLSNGENLPPETRAWLEGGDATVMLVCGPFVTQSACDAAAEALGQSPAAQFTLASTTVDRGGFLEGQIANRENIQSVTVSGPCVQDGTVTTDGQGNFQVPVNADAEEGTCVVTFTVTYDDGTTTTHQFTLTIEGPATVTARPELTNATVVRTVTTTQQTQTQPAGTYVQYTFDEAVATVGANPNEFFVYEQDNTRHTGTAIVGFSNGDRTVEVRFDGVGNALQTTTAAQRLTLATVDFGAVRDLQGLQNPEGEAPIGTAATTPTTAGVTQAPDLQSVTGFRQALAAETTAVDFVFDQPAFVDAAVAAGDFSLVLVDNTLVPCTASASDTTAGGGTVPGGSGTNTITVTCAHAGTSVAGQTSPLTPSQVARGVVLEDTVWSNQARDEFSNPLQAAAVSPAPRTIGPDLEAAAFERDVTLTAAQAQGLGAGTYDRVTYRFDQAVTVADETDFRVYQTNGNEVDAVIQTATMSQDGTQVQILFPQGTLASAVGANVGDTATTQGLRDEVGVAGAPGTVRQPGQTVAPQLTAVAVDRGTDQFGQQTAWRATYTFDANVTAVSIDPNEFYLYHGNGARYQATACDLVPPTSGATQGTQVRCTAYQTANPEFTATAPTAPNFPEIGQAVLGTVAFDAVEDSAGNSNPEGSAIVQGTTGTPQS